MESVLLVIHLFLALAIIGLVLLQRSEGGGLGIGGGSGSLGGLTTAQGAANLLTRATAICAAAFFCTSLILGVMAGGHSKAVGLLDSLDAAPAPIESPAEAPVTPEDTPSVPIAE
ncbi:MAG: preprotein translocase subunit SecG [Magnetococcus sp. WYHC-3]